ncbi:MAG: ABC transporter permease [Terriglobales bacterium]|jgi:putative ABC transport system permease protein
MRFNDVTDLATRNLREALLRNSLTTVGIAVGVASLVAMLSLGIGLQQMANSRLQKSGLFDTVVVTSRRDLRSFSREQENTGPAAAESQALDDTARAEIARIPNVIEVTPDIRFITELRYEDKPHLTMVAGMPLSDRSNDVFENMLGNFFSAPEAPEVILQKRFAEELLGINQAPNAPETDPAKLKPLLGKEIVLHYAERIYADASKQSAGTGVNFSIVPHDKTLRIVGIAIEDPEGMRGAGRGRAFIPQALAESLHIMLPSDLRESMRSFTSKPAYSSLGVKVTSASKVQAVQDAIRKMGFNTFSILDATKSLRRFFAVLDIFLGIFGSLALVIASLGIVNTLLMAILERRREIGIMKAIGASDRDVQVIFFSEAAVMGLVGGVFGVSFGWLLGRGINFGTNVYLRQLEMPPENLWSSPWWLLAGAVVFAIAVSILSGLFPAARAAKLEPVEALRYE